MTLRRNLAWVDALTASGIRATTDARKIVPPCVLFVPGRLTRVSLHRTEGINAQFKAYLIGTGQGDESSWQVLDRLLTEVTAVLPWSECDVTSFSPDSGAPYPAYLLTWEAVVSPERT